MIMSNVDVSIAAALAIAVVVPAHADGLLVPPPPAPLPYTLPYVQGAPSQSCLMTAIQLGYQTGNRYVANAAAAACRRYAPVVFPRKPWGPLLGAPIPPGFEPPPNG